MKRIVLFILLAHLLFMPVSYLTQPERYGPSDCGGPHRIILDDGAPI